MHHVCGDAAGKALHYSRFCEGWCLRMIRDWWCIARRSPRSVVGAIRGARRGSAERNAKLLHELSGRAGDQRAAYFVCAIDRGARAGRRSLLGAWRGNPGAPRGIEDLAMIPFSIFPRWKRIRGNFTRTENE